jgi:cytochrome c5
MRKMTSILAVLAVSWTAWLLLNVAVAATPANADQARIQELQQQVDALNQELTRLEGASDPAAQQQYMQRHWSMMQGHMQSLRQMPGMDAQGCRDWMMMDPSMMGRGTMGPGMMERGMMGPTGSDMCGGSMWGHGMPPGGMWGMPSHMTPGVYQSQMHGHMQRMRSQMAAIAAENDATKRQALMREHYESMYRDMQTMRGMGWMWTPDTAASLPDRDSKGARLVASICSQCHSPPAPSLHTAAEWAGVTARMRQHMQDQNNAAGGGVRLPSGEELDDITRYLEGHAGARSVH